jgi:hypothetical protein
MDPDEFYRQMEASLKRMEKMGVDPADLLLMLEEAKAARDRGKQIEKELEEARADLPRGPLQLTQSVWNLLK